jgi:serine protease Do
VITIFGSTAIRWLSAFLLAVFFSSTPKAADSSLYNLEQGMSELVFTLSRSVVAVEVTSNGPAAAPTATGQEAARHVISTGLVVDTNGYILASAPIVAGDKRITVSLDGKSWFAEVVGIDYHTNIALLKIDSHCGVPVEFSDRHACAGQMVMALGNAYGMRAAPSMGFCAGVRADGLMQFSVPITSGAIGGGVFDLKGKLLGFITAGIGTDNRLALGVPAYRLPSVVEILRTYGDHLAGFLGIRSADIEISPPLEISSPVQLASLGSENTTLIDRGVIVTGVLAGSPAARAGMQRNDLILSYGGQRFVSAADLAQTVQSSLPGSEPTMDIIRQNRVMTLRVKVGRKELDDTWYYDANDVSSDPEQVVDSLMQSLEALKREMARIEFKLRSLRR